MITDSIEMAVTSVPRGLTTEQARKLLLKWGPNVVREQRRHLLLMLLAKFWAPVPWMLEVTVVLELVLGKRLEAILIAALLMFNASLSLFQETRAHSALMLLQKRLAVATRVHRDGVWNSIPAEQLVPGDFVHLQIGDLVPADLELRDGQVLLDQPALTGESLPVEAQRGKAAYAGSLVRRGEANGEVVATGERTYFGKTAQLVRSAVTASHLNTLSSGL